MAQMVKIIKMAKLANMEHGEDKTRQQDNNSVQKAGNSRRNRLLQKRAYRFKRVNSSQRETALCSAVLAQSGTDAMVPLVPWPVPGHQRLDAGQSPLGASQHEKKKRTSTWQPINKGWWRKTYCSVSAKRS